ncbi:hypothetical protein VI03_25660 [Burkholderia vietnamiensis]|nr:hypothetical protein VI03_25660 [Burkholderia vietnamiensis]
MTIVSDSGDTLMHARKASIRLDQITSFVDVSEARGATRAKVKVGLQDPSDFINDDDEVGGVVHGRRTIFVLESYDDIKQAIAAAGSHA